MMSMRLTNKVAIITGGGTGIGKAIALAFASEGAVTVLVARTQCRLEEVANQIRSKGGKATAISTDISDENQVLKMVAQTLNKYGQIDILVNNSDVRGATANVVDINLDDWNGVLATNLTGTMLCTREVLKKMIPCQSGNIINISTNAAAGGVGVPMRSPHSASKWGVIAFTKTLAMEVGKHNIRVNCIAPGRVEGERLKRGIRADAEANGLAYEDLHEQIQNRVVTEVALRRMLPAAEVASVAVFLASNESSGLTGQTISVDAGSRL